MQQYETITMPDAGIGSFLTSNIDEIDDNELMFGKAGGIRNTPHPTHIRFIVETSQKVYFKPCYCRNIAIRLHTTWDRTVFHSIKLDADRVALKF